MTDYKEENNMRIPSTRDFNTAVAAVEQVVHSGPNITDDNGKRLLTSEQLDSVEEGVPVELDGQGTMLSRAGLSGLSRGTAVRIGPKMFVKTDVAYWNRAFEGLPLGTAMTDYVFYMMANADTRPVVTTPC